ncbi:hypothetical protein OGAPHI_003752 [Ogataea philodendri]|uniref:Uncharacterized protein n=1 Tax=Ogataea philodendri TaxID=1378263 RepID=A0A9P8P5E7_9ASCO|nr:uncharacterized protein OGAPHI_003752 [Ogataea philodendri]KAH3665565.1 hypothetical protein OGAPHI_003752 [Ogataea philodendri]
MDPLKLSPDHDYVASHHEQSWSQVVGLINPLIKSVVVDIFGADLDYEITVPLNPVGETIRAFVQRLGDKLELDFPDSPPFTIYHLTNTLLLQTPGLEPTRGLKHQLHEYKVTIYNTVSNEETVIDSDNNYFQSGRAIAETHENEVSAIKYLRALERSVFVQTSVSEVNRHLESYGSTNTVGSQEEESQDDAGSIQMVKINWPEETQISTDASPKRAATVVDNERIIKRTKNETTVESPNQDQTDQPVATPQESSGEI